MYPLPGFRGGMTTEGLGAPLLSWPSVGCHLALAGGGGGLFTQATLALQGVQAFLPSALGCGVGDIVSLVSILGCG